ncbi:MAG: hypothetical protein ABFD75_01475 [Smithella sp.]
MRVKDGKACDFYEQESIDCGWSKPSSNGKSRLLITNELSPIGANWG